MSTVTVTNDLSQVFSLFMGATELPDGVPVAPTVGDSPEVRALVVAAREGDREAFGALVAIHERIVFRTALAALGSKEDAEDAAQDAFVMAWRKLGGFRGDSSFKTWLLTITWRKALDRRRSRRLWWSRQSQPSVWEEPTPLDSYAGDDPSPEHLTMANDLADRARAEISRLTPKLRDALLLAASGEHKYEEIASLLSIPTGTVKWRVAEARKQLNTRLAR
ncbi:MAG: RNA polymerase sigma factor [Acidobacteria bacterium]|nr:RNA polymerase sigma factor [Acidobacteriota bacterium]